MEAGSYAEGGSVILELSNGRPNERSTARPISIFKLPNGMDWEFFKPLVFTIGPFSWSNQKYSKIKNDEKEWFMDDMLSKVSPPEQKNHVLEMLREKLSELEDEARQPYQKARDSQYELDRMAFLQMLLLDGCLIISILLNAARLEGDSNDNNLFGVLERNWKDVKLDLLNLRCQIPFFVLVEMVKILKNHIPEMNGFNLIESALQLFRHIFPQPTEGDGSLGENEIHHLLHLYHSRLVPSSEYRMTKTQQWNENLLASQSSPSIRIPGAFDLESSRIKCRKKEAMQSFLEISFRNGLLEIPSINVNHHIKSLFYNLIAFEQCFKPKTRFVSAYMTFMGYMMGNERDVMCLYKEGIIVTEFATDAVAGFFDEIRKHVQQDPSPNYLHIIFKEVRYHYGKRWTRWMLELKEKHFKSPWVIVSLIAGFIILVCTIIQTVYTVMSFYKS